MFGLGRLTQHFNNILREDIDSGISDEFIENEIKKFKASPKRQMMITGENYYDGVHDILFKKREVIGTDGKLEEVHNVPNNKIVDNQYAKMVDQKNNYLLAKPIVFRTENTVYGDLLKKIFNKKFQRLTNNIGEDALNNGIAYIYVYYNEEGEFKFKRFKPVEIIPGWADEEHTELEYVIRVFEVTQFKSDSEELVEKVEVYKAEGIFRYVLDNGRLKPDDNPFSTYFTSEYDGEESSWNWSKIPIIPVKYNDKETPLISKVKTLQDGLNAILSNFQNNMEEDARNTILVLMNYDGQNLGEFRKNLAEFGAVKVKTVDGAAGDIKTLSVEVNAENYKAILEIFKNAIIENAKGYDAKDDRMSGQPNQMNIQSMYSDIDLDANGMESEFQASFEDLLWFVNAHLSNAGLGDFENEEVEVIFNRDILINESEVIKNIRESVGVLSQETLISQHPWVHDPQAEIERQEKIKMEEQAEYERGFPLSPRGDSDEE